ncbi:pseudouridine synthase [Schizophyllum amplum]|uniref:Pseudouridine synthase n=1 Tax=Schizophyllum amplum TaxID=97359 RepID=A0A550CA83_9AGAR|nr:pseudouridine synthase [Auriculariopsis ampla]
MNGQHARIARLQSIISSDPRLVRLVRSKTRDQDLREVGVSGRRVFEHVLGRMLREAGAVADCRLHATGAGLMSVRPYWHYFWANAQAGWVGKTVLEVATERFKPPRPREFYAYALASGLLTVNGQIARADTVIAAGDQMATVAHRHEPVVSGAGVSVLAQDESVVVVNKPAGLPVHPVGRYRYNCMTHALKEAGLPAVRPVNRLDRLTSGVMVFPLTEEAARRLGMALRDGRVRKEYIARVRGQFSERPVLCTAPLLLVHRQLGLTIVHDEGKLCATAFVRIAYDARTDTTLVLCRPFTGRTHQIRVHLFHLGHPIPNDPYYAHPAWTEHNPPTSTPTPPAIDTSDNVHTDSLPPNLALPTLDAPDDAWAPIRAAVARAKLDITAAHADDAAAAPPTHSPPPLTITIAGQPTCPSCLRPLPHAPTPDQLRIYLHALRYTTPDGVYEAPLPDWAVLEK